MKKLVQTQSHKTDLLELPNSVQNVGSPSTARGLSPSDDILKSLGLGEGWGTGFFANLL